MKLFTLYEIIPTRRMGSVAWAKRWENAISGTARGNEEREARRSGQALKSISYTAAPRSLEERQEMEAALAAAQKNGHAAVPHWGRGCALGADLTAGTNILTLTGNAWPWANGDYVYLLEQTTGAWEAIAISNVAGSTLTLATNASRTYYAGTLCWPFLFGRLSCDAFPAIENRRGNATVQVTEFDPARSKVETSCPALTTFGGRPVFPFSIDWTRPVRRSFAFDLEELAYGFNRPDFETLRTNIVQGCEFEVLLAGADAIKAFDCFTEALRGTLTGFWLPEAQAVFEILSAPAATVLRVKAAGLATTWSADPGKHVVFTKTGAAAQFAKITNVTAVGGGEEEVTLDTALTVDATWQAFRLRYARLASELEEGRFEAENLQYRKLRAVELPEEYTTAETTSRPVYIYTFWTETPSSTWRWTSWRDAVTSNGNAFVKGNLRHGSITRATNTSREEVTITAAPMLPLTRFLPFTLPAHLWVKIEECDESDFNATEALFIGLVESVAPKGKELRATCASALDVLGGSTPNFLIGPRCNHKLFGPWCALNRASYQIATTIYSISADKRTIGITGAGLNGNNPNGFAKNSENYFALGWLELGSGVTTEILAVLASTVVDATHQLLTLNAPVNFAVVGNAAVALPGCNGRKETCVDKFNNLVNRGAHDSVPATNPSITRPATATNATKK